MVHAGVALPYDALDPDDLARALRSENLRAQRWARSRVWREGGPELRRLAIEQWLGDEDDDGPSPILEAGKLRPEEVEFLISAVDRHTPSPQLRSLMFGLSMHPNQTSRDLAIDVLAHIKADPADANPGVAEYSLPTVIRGHATSALLAAEDPEVHVLLRAEVPADELAEKALGGGLEAFAPEVEAMLFATSGDRFVSAVSKRWELPVELDAPETELEVGLPLGDVDAGIEAWRQGPAGVQAWLRELVDLDRTIDPEVWAAWDTMTHGSSAWNTIKLLMRVCERRGEFPADPSTRACLAALLGVAVVHRRLASKIQRMVNAFAAVEDASTGKAIDQLLENASLSEEVIEMAERVGQDVSEREAEASALWTALELLMQAKPEATALALPRLVGMAFDGAVMPFEAYDMVFPHHEEEAIVRLGDPRRELPWAVVARLATASGSPAWSRLMALRADHTSWPHAAWLIADTVRPCDFEILRRTLASNPPEWQREVWSAIDALHGTEHAATSTAFSQTRRRRRAGLAAAKMAARKDRAKRKKGKR